MTMKLSRLKPLFLVALAALPLFWGLFFPEDEPPPFSEESALLPFPGASKGKPYPDIAGIYGVYDAEGELLGYSASSSALGIEVSGYGGAMELVVGLDVEGRVAGVVVLGNAETPNYLYKVLESRAFSALSGKSISDRFVIGDDLDGVSRATVTWQAIVLGTKEIAAVISTGVLKRDVSFSAEGGNRTATIIKLSVVFLIFIGAFSLAKLKPKSRLLRYLSILTFTILVALIWGIFLSLQGLAYLLMGKPQPLLVIPIFYLLLFLSLLTTAIFGRTYCGYLCPLGLVMDLAYRLKTPQAKIPSWVKHYAGAVKYILLILVVLLCLHVGGVGPAGWEPFTILYLTGIKFAVVILTIVIFSASLLYPYLWCRYLCGVGAILGACSAFAPVAVRKDKNCDLCERCIPACPVEAISITGGETLPHIDPTLCLRCGECFRVCPRGAIKS